MEIRKINYSDKISMGNIKPNTEKKTSSKIKNGTKKLSFALAALAALGMSLVPSQSVEAKSKKNKQESELVLLYEEEPSSSKEEAISELITLYDEDEDILIEEDASILEEDASIFEEEIIPTEPTRATMQGVTYYRTKDENGDVYCEPVIYEEPEDFLIEEDESILEEEIIPTEPIQPPTEPDTQPKREISHNGNNQQIKYIDNNGNTVYEINYQYNDDNKIIGGTVDSNGDGVEDILYEYKYNKYGKLTDTVIYRDKDKNGEFINPETHHTILGFDYIDYEELKDRSKITGEIIPEYQTERYILSGMTDESIRKQLAKFGMPDEEIEKEIEIKHSGNFE